MAYIDSFFLKKQKTLGKAGYIKLQQKYKDKNNDVHIFVEDEDDYEFYRYYINYIYRDFKILPYYQKGKKNVIDSYNEVNWKKYSKSKVLFFIDKDYDDIIAKKNPKDLNFFITKYYSIENYLVTEEFFEIILSRIIKIRDERMVKQFIDRIKLAHEEFYRQMIPITSLILIYRKLGTQMKLNNLSLSYFLKINNLEVIPVNYCKQKKFEKIVSSSINGFEKSLVTNKKKLNEILDKCEADPKSCNLAMLLNNKRELGSIKCKKKFIRGKYEFWFLFEMIKSIEREVSILNKKISADNDSKSLEKQKTPLLKKCFVIDANTIFHIFPPKMKMPKDIETFLTLNYSKI